LVEHDREIAGAGDILLDNVLVNFEPIWHTLTADPQLNVVFIEWNRSGQRYTKLGITTVCFSTDMQGRWNWGVGGHRRHEPADLTGASII